MKSTNRPRPVANALETRSGLQEHVKTGLEAMGADKAALEEKIRSEFCDSLNLDLALRDAFPRNHRWDFVLGHESSVLMAVEVHSANSNEVSNVIQKREHAKAQLKGRLKPSARVGKWFWVASGSVQLHPFDKQMRRLDQNGITFVGRVLSKRHLTR